MGIVRRAATAAAVTGAATRAHNRNTPSQPTAASAPAPAAPAADDTSAKLHELADLHAKGILSDEEFAAAKAKVLGI